MLTFHGSRINSSDPDCLTAQTERFVPQQRASAQRAALTHIIITLDTSRDDRVSPYFRMKKDPIPGV